MSGSGKAARRSRRLWPGDGARLRASRRARPAQPPAAGPACGRGQGFGVAGGLGDRSPARRPTPGPRLLLGGGWLCPCRGVSLSMECVLTRPPQNCSFGALEAPCPEAMLEMWVLIHLCLSRAAWAAQGLTQDRHTGSACHGAPLPPYVQL